MAPAAQVSLDYTFGAHDGELWASLPAPPLPATGIVAGDLRRGDDARRGRTGPTTHHGAGGRTPTGPLGGDWGLMAKAPPPPPPSAREERVSPDFARPPGFRPDLADEGPRSERRPSAKSPGATADRHSQDQRSAPRGRFPAPKPQKAPKPLSGREFNDGLRKGGVDPDRPVTPDTLRQAVGERDYQRRREPDLFAGVAAGFRSLFPGDVARDATGRMKASQPRPGVTFRSVLAEFGIGSLDAAHRAGRRKAAGSLAGGGGDDTLGNQSGHDVIFTESEDGGSRDRAAPPQDIADIDDESEDWAFATAPFGGGQQVIKSTGPIKVTRRTSTLGVDGGYFTVGWYPLDENGKRLQVVQAPNYPPTYGGHIGPFTKQQFVVNPPWHHEHGFEVTIGVPPQPAAHGNTAGIDYQVYRHR